MKKIAIVGAAIGASLALTACQPAHAVEVTPYGVIEVGGYYNDGVKDEYVSDTNASIGLTFTDGNTVGAVEFDAANTDINAVVLDKAWVGYKAGSTLIQVGRHDSVFDNTSGFGDVAIEFGHGANEQDLVGGDIDGASIQYNGERLYVGASAAVFVEGFTDAGSLQLHGAQFAGFNGAVQFQLDESTRIGAAVSRANYELDDGTNVQNVSYTAGVEVVDGNTTVGANYNGFYDNGDRTTSTEFSAAHNVGKLTVAGQVTFKNLDLAVEDYSATAEWEGMTAGIGAVYSFSDSLSVLVDAEHNFDIDETRSFAKVIAEF